MINKAFLHPSIRARMDFMMKTGRQFGFAPIITSTVRDRGKQQDEWNKCQRGASRFPVKEPGCSQHEYGYAFDMQVTKGAFVADQPVPGKISALACAVLGICPEGGERLDLPSGQFAVQLQGRKLGLSNSQSDPIHFSIFPSATWDPHMRSEFGIGCRTCRPPELLDPTSLEFIQFQFPSPRRPDDPLGL